MKKFFKWFGIVILALIALPIVIGLSTRLFMADVPAPGKLYDVGGFNLHIDCQGEPNDLPAVIIEGGAGSASPNYYWLQQQLKDRVQVCRYDRAGLGWSDDSVTPRDADTVTSELHALLAAAEVEPPYIIAGHSLGGALMRVYTDRYPEDVVGLMFIDSSHPDQLNRYESIGIQNPAEASFGIFKVMRVLGELGLLSYMFGGEPTADNLPASQLEALRWMARDGRMAKEGLKEMKRLADVLNRAAVTTDFGDMPVRVFSANVGGGAPEGIDPDTYKGVGETLHLELAALSSDGKRIVVDGATHTSINSNRNYAKVVSDEIHQVLDAMEAELQRGEIDELQQDEIKELRLEVTK